MYELRSVKLFLILFYAKSIGCYRILGLFPHQAVSHFHFFDPVMRALAYAGHDVTVVSHFPSKTSSQNYRDEPLIGLEALTNSVNLEVSIKVQQTT